MNFLERIPTRWLLTGAALACLLLWAGPGWAQATGGDPVVGRRLYEDTSNESGNSQLTGSCNSGCHGDVQNRRSRIGGGPFAQIDPEEALSRVLVATNNIQAMFQFRPPALSMEQHGDIAAYIADTPKTSDADLSFTATAINTNTLSQSVDLSNSITSGTLTITAVTITGTGAARFTATSDTCTSQTLAASTLATPSTCRVSVRFSAPDTASHAATLRMTMRVQGSMTTFTRDVALSGQVGTPAPPPSNNSGDSGGGALGLAWLSGLALATAVLARRRRA